ncbi:hypothetical protein DRQ25_11025, partial [Candidatus Fermentibacteria bacterium]
MKILICVLSAALFTISSMSTGNGIIYISPLDGSDWQSTESSLIIGFDGPVPEILDVHVTGSVSGEYECRRYVSSDGERLVLTPVPAFTLGEKVDVSIKWSSSSTEWSFTVRPENPPETPFSCQEDNSFNSSDHRPRGFGRNLSGDVYSEVSLPSDFPE